MLPRACLRTLSARVFSDLESLSQVKYDVVSERVVEVIKEVRVDQPIPVVRNCFFCLCMWSCVMRLKAPSLAARARAHTHTSSLWLKILKRLQLILILICIAFLS